MKNLSPSNEPVVRMYTSLNDWRVEIAFPDNLDWLKTEGGREKIHDFLDKFLTTYEKGLS